MDAVTLPYIVYCFGLAARDLKKENRLVILNYRFQQLLGIGMHFGFKRDALDELLKCLPHIMDVTSKLVYDPRIVQAESLPDVNGVPSEIRKSVSDAKQALVDKMVPAEGEGTDPAKVVAAMAEAKAFYALLKSLFPETLPFFPDFEARYKPPQQVALLVATGFLMSLQQSLGSCAVEYNMVKETRLVELCRRMFMEFQTINENQDV